MAWQLGRNYGGQTLVYSDSGRKVGPSPGEAGRVIVAADAVYDVSSGVWYWETVLQPLTNTAADGVGILNPNDPPLSNLGFGSNHSVGCFADGARYMNGTNENGSRSFTTAGVVVGHLLDFDALTYSIRRGGIWSTPVTFAAGQTYSPAYTGAVGTGCTLYVHANEFTDAIPSGAQALGAAVPALLFSASSIIPIF